MTARRLRISVCSTVRRVITERTAAPEGGARTPLREWVRGCVAAVFLATPVAAQEVPSGQNVTLSEVLIDSVGAEQWLRFRFLAPQIARDDGDLSYADVADDFQHLCDGFATPYMADFDLEGDVIVISLMDRPVPFGTADPDATQFFEAFRVEDGACVWSDL